MKRNGEPRDAYALERELRERLSKTEYSVLQSRLTGAVKAIATLRDRAPDLVPLMFGDTLHQARTLPTHTQSALATLIEELLIVAAADRRGHVNRQKLLRLVNKVNAHETT